MPTRKSLCLVFTGVLKQPTRIGPESKGPALPALCRYGRSAASALAYDALFYDARGDEHQELGLVVRAGVVAEKDPEKRQVPEERHPGDRVLQGLGVNGPVHIP